MEELELLDWKRRIFALYAEIRSDPRPERAWQRWRDVRDDLFRSHPQTPSAVAHLRYFDYEYGCSPDVAISRCSRSAGSTLP